MRRVDSTQLKKLAVAIGTYGTIGQFGSCDLGQITTTQTLDGRQVIISLIRGALITPLDQWVTDTINDAFGEEV